MPEEYGCWLPVAIIVFRHYISRQSKPCQNGTSCFDILESDLAHEFMVVKIKRDLEEVKDPEQLRQACLLLIDLMEKQKAAFKSLIGGFFEEELEKPNQ